MLTIRITESIGDYEKETLVRVSDATPDERVTIIDRVIGMAADECEVDIWTEGNCKCMKCKHTFIGYNVDGIKCPMCSGPVMTI
ncbi:hypothetical protein [Paenibacillus macquariensis]|uniref:Uncharacterized protein n=1 Tax=Paenibacillus macquariensis TaxID=948756 RepID=A0ABY1JS30_9BACL|nr:hypothetical protein [Paenibacillus macquariensis]MEC0092872.1 hypothetical protein [Paenibacillus macquariensis]OAB36248.1 hypothetical protein PMSM_07305 [Paenibacillus macquariensis subsp. macquariensis]SIQ67899.1 hypothetical protein SAMN05421578_103326 [Paenibacillus macquariensis]